MVFNFRTDVEKEFYREIYEDRYYFANGFDIEAGMRVLDIGGHVGFFTLLSSYIGAEVYAFEPVLENFLILQKHLKLNNLSANVFHGAIGIKNAWGTVEVAKGQNTGLSHLGDTGEPTPIYGMDFVNSLKCDYVKLDCEGAELQIVPLLDSDTVKYITMEFHGDNEEHAQANGRYLESVLKMNGYETFYSYSYGNQGRLQGRKCNNCI